MPSLNHLHTYRKFHKTNQYACSDPYCTHRADKMILVGKAALCASCQNEFILTREALKRATPKCIFCMDTKASRELKNKKIVLEAMGFE